jgi:hypothetical protein
MPGFDQPVNHVRTNKASSTGNQNTHGEHPVSERIYGPRRAARTI